MLAVALVVEVINCDPQDEQWAAHTTLGVW